jgi:hypothetical protein
MLHFARPCATGIHAGFVALREPTLRRIWTSDSGELSHDKTTL